MERPTTIFDSVFEIDTQKDIPESDLPSIKEILEKAYSIPPERVLEITLWKKKHVFVGLQLNVFTDPLRSIDRGPPPKDPKAESFRQFWGETILYRFPDGQLLEALEWKHDPLKEIAMHVLNRHYFSGTKFNLIFAPRSVSPIFVLPGHKQDPSKINSITNCYDELVSILRSLKTTLSITSVSPISPYLSRTAVFPYEPIEAGSLFCTCQPSITILGHVESSTAWPLELRALVQFKIAIQLEIAKLINEQKEQRGIEALPHPEGVYIFLHGFVFNLLIIHPDESHHFAETPHGQEVDFIEKVQTIHYSFIKALTERYTSFSEATRAAIRWTRAKGISSLLLSQEAIELLVAVSYCSEKPPLYSLTGFLRFLEVLAQLSKNHVISINDARVDSSASNLPLVIATPYAKNSIFTQKVKSFVPSFLAKAAQNSLKIALEGEFSEPKQLMNRLFAVPTSHWSYKVMLDIHQIPAAERALFSTGRFKGRFEEQAKVMPTLSDMMIDFDPINMFLNEISNRYGKLLNFWYDDIAGHVIGISYPNSILKEESLKENELDNKKKLPDGHVQVDIECIMQEIQAIGGEMVSSIQRSTKLL